MKASALFLATLLATVSASAVASPDCTPAQVAELKAGLRARADDVDLSIGDRDLAELILSDYEKDTFRHGCKRHVTYLGVVQYLTATSTIVTAITFTGSVATKIRAKRLYSVDP